MSWVSRTKLELGTHLLYATPVPLSFQGLVKWPVSVGWVCMVLEDVKLDLETDNEWKKVDVAEWSLEVSFTPESRLRTLNTVETSSFDRACSGIAWDDAMVSGITNTLSAS